LTLFYLQITPRILPNEGNVSTKKPKPSVRRGRKAAGLMSKRKMAELPMGLNR